MSKRLDVTTLIVLSLLLVSVIPATKGDDEILDALTFDGCVADLFSVPTRDRIFLFHQVSPTILKT